MKLAVGVISNRDWRPQFGVSLVHMLNASGGKFDGMGFFSRVNCSLPPRGRRLIIDDATKAGFTHLLFIDDDMQFPPDAAIRLAAHGKPFVAANYQSRTSRGEPVAVGLDELPAFSRDRRGLQEIDRIGFGLVFLDLGVVATLPPPLFAVTWLINSGTELGEDYYFCRHWRKHGHPIFVDHDLSNEVLHWGDVGLATP